MINQVCEGLYAPDYRKEMSPVPRIASEMGTWNDDLTELTIPLRDDVTFHDGTPLTAADVVWNFDRIWDVSNRSVSAHSELWKNDQNQMIWSAIKAVDEYSVKFTLRKPWIVFEKLLAFCGSYLIKPNMDLEHRFLSVNEPLIGTGPFRFVEMVSENQTVVEGNKHYYRGAPSIKSMIFQANPDTDTASQAFLNHEIHFGNVRDDYLDQANADPSIQIQKVKQAEVFYLEFNTNRSKAGYLPRVVREAMNFAFNYTHLLEIINENEHYEIHQPIPAGMQYSDDLANLEGLAQYNLSYARHILLNDPDFGPKCAQAGLTDSSSDQEWIEVAQSNMNLSQIEFGHYGSTFISNLILQLTRDMELIGFELIDDIFGWSWWPDGGYPDTNEIRFTGYGSIIYVDPISMIQPILQTGAPYHEFGYSDPEIDQLIAQTYAVPASTRKAVFLNITKKLFTKGGEYPLLYLFQFGSRLMWNTDYIKNIDDNLNVFRAFYFYNCNIPDYSLNIFSFPLYGLGLVMIGTSVVLFVITLQKRKNFVEIL